MKRLLATLFATSILISSPSAQAEDLAYDGPNHAGVKARLIGMKEILGGVEATFQAVCRSSGKREIYGSAVFRAYSRGANNKMQQQQVEASCYTSTNDIFDGGPTKEEGGKQVTIFIDNVKISDRGKKFELSAAAGVNEKRGGILTDIDKERLKFQKKLGL
ncbi:MAG: hypothetical protein ACWA44_15435 [Thiotrichales bacterium]